MRPTDIELLEDRIVLAGDGANSAKPLDGDINSDNEVNFADFLTLRENFGAGSAASRSDGDLNEDGMVNFADFLILSSNFGRTTSLGDVNLDGTLSVEDAYVVRDAVLANSEYDSLLDVNTDCTIDRFDVKVVVDALIAEHHPMVGDLNIDGKVDFADLLIVDENFGKQVVGGWIDGDVDEDGIVTFRDLLLMDPSPF
jgi:hypothetical protein